ncbi:protein farnesyltransferase/geranylgeranyltransferase type-1 subunit alpha isoform X2 [Ischnura elegans]|uniref:protein farnesyltransferase/geranylgeranyltransferase type-1 subunit alpha isoform X2 n=1 Tax=Ischnura elegans TaxID=197161 RepID=UPI001ED871B6|nr:protein farnesyltransferase/geranylgeranyltransferase type-1 subunit alpha isoform X2 [Ischnura elegans]
MADSSSEEHGEEPTWVFYKDRPGWKDVVPISQSDGPYPVVAIAYSEKFRDVYDYFRAILKSKEKSERAIQLTKDALDLNPANYTVWQYRRELLKSLNKNLHEELRYVWQMIEDNPKNYQVWHHCRVVVEWLNDPSRELLLTETILGQDAKNYHAWQHRQWVVRTFNLFDQELDFVARLIEDDVRNNSAWNQRYFVINNTRLFTPEVIEREVNYTLEKIKVATNNESAWNYLRGVLEHQENGLAGQGGLVKQFCEELYTSYPAGAKGKSPYLLAYLVDLHEEQMQLGIGDKSEHLKIALEICESLAAEHDTIRRGYWNYVAQSLEKRFKNGSDANCEQPAAASGDS